MPRAADALVSQSNSRRRPLLIALLASLRPKQWTKNGLLFLGLIFSGTLYDPDRLLRSVLAFVTFCALSSSTYIVNDIMDAEQDRLHPLKKHRPIASREVSVPLAMSVAIVFLVVGLALGAALGAGFAVAAILYPILTFSYSLVLKHVAIVDLIAIAAFYVLRAGAGAVVIGVPISPWLYVCTLLGALFIAAAKRRHELILLQASAREHRRILDSYTVPFLDQLISILAAASVIAYCLYTFSAENLPRNQAMMLTIPFVIYGIFRYLFLVQSRDVGGSPEEALLKDVPLLATVVGWGIASTVIIYVFR